MKNEDLPEILLLFPMELTRGGHRLIFCKSDEPDNWRADKFVKTAMNDILINLKLSYFYI